MFYYIASGATVKNFSVGKNDGNLKENEMNERLTYLKLRKFSKLGLFPLINVFSAAFE